MRQERPYGRRDLPSRKRITGPTNVVLASFSSCGPTDTGASNRRSRGGVNEITPGASTDSEYVQWPTGGRVLPRRGGRLRRASVAVLQTASPESSEPLASTSRPSYHTADSCTTNAGPSYRFGWGVMNTPLPQPY